MKLNKYLQSKIHCKIIKFFHENPSSIDTSRGIATWINENAAETETALKKLVKDKIIIPHGNHATSAYGYTTDTHLITKIRAEFEKAKDKQKKKSH